MYKVIPPLSHFVLHARVYQILNLDGGLYMTMRYLMLTIHTYTFLF